mmetsp:Transcript_5792/g.13746  ORF Transcript_5792/g.13746 Transcript_5792/m.13746 type:complete len:132 (-) Transcript_5792:15-410(-)
MQPVDERRNLATDVARLRGECPGMTEEHAFSTLEVLECLQRMDEWARTKVIQEAGQWIIVGERFSPTFESCSTEVVIPLCTTHFLNMALHDVFATTFGGAVTYGIVDDPGGVVFYRIAAHGLPSIRHVQCS